MTGKNLARRLERLEAELTPGDDEVLVPDVQGITPDRQVVSSTELIVHIPQRPLKPRYR